MAFVFEGILVRKNLPASVRKKLMACRWLWTLPFLPPWGGGNGSKQIAEYWKNNRALLQERWGFVFPKSNPAIATINRIMQLVDPEQFQEALQKYPLTRR